MRKKNLGSKHICKQCGCKFYDLGKPRPSCPKCGVEPATETKRTVSATSTRTTSEGASLYTPPPKARQKKVHDDDGWEGEEGSFEEVDDSDTLADGLSLIEEDELTDDDEKD